MTVGDPAVRDAAPGDARTIAEIRVASWQATYAGLVPQHVLDGLDVAGNEAWLTRRLADPGATATLVVEDGRRVVGYALLGPARDVDTAGVGEIEAIYLAPPALGRGFGRALMGEAVNRVGAMGYPAVVLWVLAGNDVARRFYERAGFKTDGTARMLNFDGTPIEEIRYRRSIA